MGEKKLEKENQEQLIDKTTFSVEQKEIRTPFFLGITLIVLVGIATGYFLSRKGLSFFKRGGGGAAKKIVGAKDTSAFKDQATGVIEEGGMDGEGTHKLIREGGPSQTAYLTSSVVDLGEFIGKKVRVWGETFAGQKAGWLMDVGRVELLE